MLFGRKKAQPRIDQERVARALLTPAVATMLLDGDLDIAEVDAIRDFTREDPAFRGLPPQRIIDFMSEIALDWNRLGGAKVMRDAAAQLDAPQREAAFELACRVMFADGKVDPAEYQTVLTASFDFGLTPLRATELLDKTRRERVFG